jgi:hypothetical protein
MINEALVIASLPYIVELIKWVWKAEMDYLDSKEKHEYVKKVTNGTYSDSDICTMVECMHNLNVFKKREEND